MTFMRIFPLQEIEQTADVHFGHGHPARCMAVDRFSAREYYLNVHEIADFEECPLYLICEAESDGLVNGIRLRLRGGQLLIVPDDASEETENFLSLLARALKGEIVEMAYSRYLQELERQKLI